MKNSTKIPFRPLGDRALIQPVSTEEKTAGGIFIPDSAKEKPLKGKVISVGPGRSGIPMQVKDGDDVLYSKYSGTEIKIGTEDFIVVREEDILGVLN